MLNISCDIDGVLADFYKPYFERFTKESNITKNVLNILSKDKDFWMSLPVLNRPNFKVRQYTTARCIPKSWIRDYLEASGMPKAPIYQLMSYCLNKVPKIKMGGCDLHIDDSIEVFIKCNLQGVPCLLMDSPNNKDWGPIGRIYTLDKDEVFDCYYLFNQTVFPYFKELL